MIKLDPNFTAFPDGLNLEMPNEKNWRKHKRIYFVYWTREYFLEQGTKNANHNGEHHLSSLKFLYEKNYKTPLSDKLQTRNITCNTVRQPRFSNNKRNNMAVSK